MARILLGVSGSIAAYKAADLASRLKKAGHSVTVVMTKSAGELVSPNTFMNLTGNHVFTELWGPTAGQTEHIRITDEAELVVIAPATANTIAKLAVGLADDMLSTTLLAVRCPVLVCPAMNTRMWNHPTVAQNLATLRTRGVLVLEPDAGALACGHVGPGRLAEPPEIHARVEQLLRELKPDVTRPGASAQPGALETMPGAAPATTRFFLERQTIRLTASEELLAAERAYRANLRHQGQLTGSGAVGEGAREAVHVHRAGSLDEARARAAASPLAKANASTSELAEWKLESGPPS